MNTEHTHEQGANPPIEELRAAIERYALVREGNGVRMVANEKSGARAAWLFDFRSLMLQPEWLDRLAEVFWERFASKLPFQVGGIETAGIPLVAAIIMKSVQRKTPVNGFYVRKSRKRYGLMKYIEGTLGDDPIILVDDLIHSGESIRKQLDIIEQAGKKVSDVFVLLAYRPDDSYEFLRQRGTNLTRLFTLPDFGLPYQRTPVLEKEAFEVLWRYAAPEPSLHIVLQKSAPVADSERVYFGRDDGSFISLNAHDGSVAWEFKAGKHPFGKGILSSPALHRDRVFFGSYDGNVYALDAASGQKVWVHADADWVGSSPDIAPNLGLLYIGLEHGLIGKRGGIAALDVATGQRVWHAYHPSLTHGSPLYIQNERLVVIGSNNGILYAYDAKTGEPRWKVAAQSDIKTRATYDPKRRLVLFSALDGIFYAVRAQDGMPVHARELGAGTYSIPLVEGNTVYVSCLDKCVYAINLDTWSERWVFETAGRIFASPLLHGGSLWVGSNDGRLYEIDAGSGTRRSSHQFTERIVNRVVIRDNRIFVPTVANELYCIRKIV